MRELLSLLLIIFSFDVHGMENKTSIIPLKQQENPRGEIFTLDSVIKEVSKSLPYGYFNPGNNTRVCNWFRIACYANRDQVISIFASDLQEIMEELYRDKVVSKPCKINETAYQLFVEECKKRKKCRPMLGKYEHKYCFPLLWHNLAEHITNKYQKKDKKEIVTLSPFEIAMVILMKIKMNNEDCKKKTTAEFGVWLTSKIEQIDCISLNVDPSIELLINGKTKKMQGSFAQCLRGLYGMKKLYEEEIYKFDGRNQVWYAKKIKQLSEQELLNVNEIIEIVNMSHYYPAHKTWEL